jgi:hypothetical protein
VSDAVVLLVVLALVGGPLAFGTRWSPDVVAWLMLATTFTVVGAAVVSRVPENPFGWLLLSIGATSAITVSIASGQVPGALAWLRSWVVYVPVGLLPIALLVFPTGRLPSARWRPALVLAASGVTVLTFFLAVASAIEPDPLGIYGPPAGSRVDGFLSLGFRSCLGCCRWSRGCAARRTSSAVRSCVCCSARAYCSLGWRSSSRA